MFNFASKEKREERQGEKGKEGGKKRKGKKGKGNMAMVRKESFFFLKKLIIWRPPLNVFLFDFIRFSH